MRDLGRWQGLSLQIPWRHPSSHLEHPRGYLEGSWSSLPKDKTICSVIKISDILHTFGHQRLRRPCVQSLNFPEREELCLKKKELLRVQKVLLTVIRLKPDSSIMWMAGALPVFICFAVWWRVLCILGLITWSLSRLSAPLHSVCNVNVQLQTTFNW